MTESDRALLAFEGRWWRYEGAKAQAVRDRFGLSLTRYYQKLAWLAHDPAAEAEFPALIHRLQRRMAG